MMMCALNHCDRNWECLRRNKEKVIYVKEELGCQARELILQIRDAIMSKHFKNTKLETMGTPEIESTGRI